MLFRSVDNLDFRRMLKDPKILNTFNVEIEKQAQDLVKEAIKNARNKPQNEITKSRQILIRATAKISKAQTELQTAKSAWETAAQNRASHSAEDIQNLEKAFERAETKLKAIQEEYKTASTNYQETLRVYDTPEAIAEANSIADNMEYKKGVIVEQIKNEILSSVNK